MPVVSEQATRTTHLQPNQLPGPAKACRVDRVMCASVHSLEPSPPAIYGREALVAELRTACSGLVVVYGDSGIGKSAVLRALAGPAKVAEVHGYAGALINALLEQLSAQLAAVSLPAARRRVGSMLRSAVSSLTGSTSAEIIKFLGRQVASIVSAKWGAEAGNILQDLTNATASDVGSSLQARLSAATEPEAPAAFATLAREAAEALGPLHFILDTRVAPSASDLELMSSLPTLLPSKVGVTIALTVASTQDDQTLRRLEAAGASTVEVRPLTRSDVEDWISFTGGDRQRASEVVQTTGGYPLFVEAALVELAAGRPLENLSPPLAFVARTRLAWSSLSLDERRAAQRLAYFTYPLSDAAACAVTELSTEDWLQVQQSLATARIFSQASASNASTWFHDRKRRVVQQLQNAASLAASAEGALRAIWDQATLLEYQHCADLATLAMNAPQTSLPGRARSVTELSRDALACFSALLELYEPQGADPSFVPTSEVLRRATRATSSGIPSPATMEELRHAGLVGVYSNEGASIATPTLQSAGEHLLLLGRCVGEFGSLPREALAGTVVRGLLIPRLYGYAVIRYGVGGPSDSGLPAQNDREWFALEPPPWGLTIRARLADELVFTHACFTSQEARDQAADDLDGLPTQFLGEKFVSEFVLRTPMPATRCLRFVRAWNVASRVSINDSLTPLRIPALPPETWVETLCRARALVRDRCDLPERFATGLLAPASFAYVLEDGRLLIAELSSEKERAVRCRMPDVSDPFRDPMFSVEFARFNDLAPDETIRRLTVEYRTSADAVHPAAQIVCDVSQRARGFNREFGEPISLGDLGDIEALLGAGLLKCYEDAQALLDARVVPEPVEALRPRRWRVIFHLTPNGAMGRPQFLGTAVSTHADSPELTVEIADDVRVRELLDDLRTSPADGLRTHEFAYAGGLIEHFLGVDRNGIDLQSLRRVFDIDQDYRILC